MTPVHMHPICQPKIGLKLWQDGSAYHNQTFTLLHQCNERDAILILQASGLFPLPSPTCLRPVKLPPCPSEDISRQLRLVTASKLDHFDTKSIGHKGHHQGTYWIVHQTRSPTALSRPAEYGHVLPGLWSHHLVFNFSFPAPYDHQGDSGRFVLNKPRHLLEPNYLRLAS
jgi:hypothetical protein